VEMAQTASRKPGCVQRDFYANLVWMMSGFSCHSSFSTHIYACVSSASAGHHGDAGLAFLKVLNPARMLPPVHVVYIRSGGANILILMSFTASRCTSWSSLLPKPFVNVDPPESTILP
jgi:hypothetical protein